MFNGGFEVEFYIRFSWKEGLVVVANISQHLDLLSGVMMYLRSQRCKRQRKCPVTIGFLDKEWSCSMALLACATMAVSQSQYAYKELEHLKVTYLCMQ
jgi:hypothetical protein